jgi:hypothetical protein
MREEQHVFRAGRSRNDLIFSIQQIIEKRWEYDKCVITAFIDIKQAYERVRTETIWEVLDRIRILNGTE